MSGRVAIVVHRYGPDVAGGAETFARRLAESLAGALEVTVLTTCAADYRTWADHFTAGESELNGVRVLRFPVPEPRDPREFDRVSELAYAAPDDAELGERWMRAQGPNAPGLIAHLRQRGHGYDAVVFQPYLYATTADGIACVPERALLCPSLHDEPPARLSRFDRVFEAARLVLFHTPEEREFARSRFGVQDARARVLGSPMDPPPLADADRFRAAFGVTRPYAVCVGRVDASKGVPDLVTAHGRYRAQAPAGLDLVLVGPGELELPAVPWLTRTGFVDEATKHDAIGGAEVLVAPSPYESLCYAQLEAWSHGRPTLANAASPVLEGQSRRSGGGLWYRDADEYAAMLDLLGRSPALAEAIGRQGRRWVATSCGWDDWRGAWLEAIREVAAAAAPASDHAIADGAP